MAELLKSRRNAHALLAALQIGSLFAIVLSAVLKYFELIVASAVAFLIGTVTAAVGLYIALYIVVELGGPSSRKTAIATAIIFLLTAVSLLFSGPLWELCHGSMISICCGALAALLTAVFLSFITDKSLTPIIIAVGVVFALAVFFGLGSFAIYGIIALSIASAVAAVVAVKKARMFSMCAILLSVLAILACLSSLVDGQQGRIYPLLPFAAAIGCAAIITAGVASLSWPAAVRSEKRAAHTQKAAAKPAERPVQRSAQKPPESQATLAARWVNKAYAGKSFGEIADSPVDALYGVSAEDAKLLKDAFRIITVRDLATSKYFTWADDIVKEAESQKSDN